EPGLQTGSCASTGGGWSVAEIVEHLVRAEDYGILGLWSSFPDPESKGIPLDAALASRSIDEIFRETPARVDAPPAVEPRAGGRPVAYWVARLRSHDAVIAELAEAMEGVGFSQVVYPHHIVGPLDGAQRLQFFRWHLERHLAQIERTVVPTAAN
ncbi:MAG: DinB family protein, partial [Candidatus Nanopelagicales bacterium]